MLLSICVVVAAFGAVSAFAGQMQSKRVATNVCKTKSGGRFVEIRQFPGEMIDRRLRKDVRFLVRKYKIFVTDGYSESSVHSLNGEHPLGLALDIVPNFDKGGSWDLIDKLAKWAEPVQNQVRPPFRWVGYDGDINHGRGHHLHLSFDHGNSKPFTPTRRMFSVKCPQAGKTDTGEEPTTDPTPDPGTTGGQGTKGSKGGKGGKGGQTVNSGGISARQARVVEHSQEHSEAEEMDRSRPVKDGSH